MEFLKACNYLSLFRLRNDRFQLFRIVYLSPNSLSQFSSGESGIVDNHPSVRLFLNARFYEVISFKISNRNHRFAPNKL